MLDAFAALCAIAGLVYFMWPLDWNDGGLLVLLGVAAYFKARDQRQYVVSEQRVALEKVKRDFWLNLMKESENRAIIAWGLGVFLAVFIAACVTLYKVWELPR